MLYVIKWLYAWVLPLGGLVLALLIVTAYMFWKRAPGRKPLLLVVALLYALAIAPVSGPLIKSLETRYEPPQEISGDVIILLGGGARSGVPDFDGQGQIGSAAANRFLTAVRIQKAKNLPIILSGGVVLDTEANEAQIERRMLLSLGVPADKIIIEDKSRNTAENARFSKAICEQHRWQKPIVVTSAFHMPRSVAFFQREGMDIIPYPSDYRTNSEYHYSAYSIIPDSFELLNSCLAIKEYVGIGAMKAGLQ